MFGLAISQNLIERADGVYKCWQCKQNEQYTEEAVLQPYWYSYAAWIPNPKKAGTRTLLRSRNDGGNIIDESGNPIRCLAMEDGKAHLDRVSDELREQFGDDIPNTEWARAFEREPRMFIAYNVLSFYSSRFAVLRSL